jgi:vacuolar-type H+-ATPase subunit H
MRFGRRRVPPQNAQPLEEVFAAERAAAADIAAARRDAEAWLAAEKADIERRRVEDLALLDASHAAGVEEARRHASSEADAIVAAAEAYARGLQAIRDEELLPVVVRHLAAILPGGPT